MSATAPRADEAAAPGDADTSAPEAAPGLDLEHVLLDLPGGPMLLEFTPAHAELAREIAALWSHVSLPLDASGAGPAPDPHRLSAPEDPGAGVKGEVVTPGDGASYAVSGYITREVISALIGEKLLLHSGAVRIPGHGVVLLIGPSGAGKSTASTHLGRMGEYLTDELTILDPQSLRVTGFPKPVSRIQRDLDGAPKRDLGLASQGLRPIRESEPPSHVLLLNRRQEGEGTSGVRRLPLHEAVLQMVAQSSSVWTLPDGLETMARLLTSVGGAVEITYADADEIPGLLDALPARIEEEWETVAGIGADADASGLVRCLPFAGALVTDEATVLLRTGTVLTLQGLSDIVWEIVRAEGPLPLERLEEETVAMIGPHPESSALIAAALAELVQQGAVEQDAVQQTAVQQTAVQEDAAETIPAESAPAEDSPADQGSAPSS